MPYKDLHQSPFSDETVTKLEIFEEYLNEWLPVFIQTGAFQQAYICDFFAGTGADMNGVLGSPLRIVNGLRKFREQIEATGMRITVILGELDGAKCAELERCISQAEDELALKNIEFEVHKRDFQELLRDKAPLFARAPALLFIDQNGVKQVTPKVLATFAAMPYTDFLFFISSSYFKRFAGEPSFRNAFPDIDVQHIASSRQSDIHKIMIDYFRAKIPHGNPTRLYPFTLKKDRNVYGLVFGSKHPLGVDKFLRVAWRKNRKNGSANFDIEEDYKAAQTELFGNRRRTKLERFEEDLRTRVANAEMTTNCQVYDFALSRGFLPKHASDLLRKMKLEGILSYEGQPTVNYDSCYSARKKKLKEYRVRRQQNGR